MSTNIEIGENFEHITQPEKMTIIEIGGKLEFFPNDLSVQELLEPSKVYVLDIGPSIGLIETSALQLPEKVYDFEQQFREQILKTLRNSQHMNIGVLLEGYKGQGKSVTATQLAIESKLPIILINKSIPINADFISFLSGIKQDYCLLIDEFEKIFLHNNYNSSEPPSIHTQDSFLTFMSGVNSSEHKRLIILTSNDQIGDKFINRPGRIRYYKTYNFMSNEIFHAVIEDKLINKEFKEDLIDNINISDCTIDILCSIIDEINIQENPYSSFKEYFNHKPKKITYSKYILKGDEYKYVNDIEIEKEITIESNLHHLRHHLEFDSYNIKIDYIDKRRIEFSVVEDHYDVDPNDPEKEIHTKKKEKYKFVKVTALTKVSSSGHVSPIL
jgi:hypothetical protein